MAYIEQYPGIWEDTSTNSLLKPWEKEFKKDSLNFTLNGKNVTTIIEDKEELKKQEELRKKELKQKDTILLILYDLKLLDDAKKNIGWEYFSGESAHKQRARYEAHQNVEEDDVSFLRNYTSLANLEYLNLDSPELDSYKNKYADLSETSLSDINKFKRRSLLSLWEKNPNWNYKNQDDKYLLDSPMGKEMFEAVGYSDEDYNNLKNFTNGQLITLYPLVFDDLMMYALGKYYGGIQKQYENMPRSQWENENLGFASFNTKRQLLNAELRRLSYLKHKNKGGKDEDTEFGGWSRLWRNTVSIAGAISDIVFKDWGTLLFNIGKYKNDQRDAADNVVTQVADYFSNKLSLDRDTIDKYATEFDFLAEQLYGNYNSEVKDALDDETKADKLRQLRMKAFITGNTNIINKELKEYLQNKEYENLGKLDYLGTLLYKANNMAMGTGAQVAGFMWESPNMLYDLGALAITGTGALFGAEDAFDDAIEGTIQHLNLALNNDLVTWANNVESTGNYIPAGVNIPIPRFRNEESKNQEKYFRNQEDYLRGIEYTQDEINNLLSRGIIEKEDIPGLRKDAGKTFGLWTRQAGEEDSFLNAGTFLDALGVAFQMAGTKGASSILRNTVGRAAVASGSALTSRATNLLTTNRAILGLDYTTKAGSKLFKPIKINPVVAKGISKVESKVGKFLYTSGNIINAEAPILANVGLDFGYAKSAYDAHMQEAEDYVNGKDFRDKVAKKAHDLYNNSEEYREQVHSTARANYDSDLLLLYNDHQEEIEKDIESKMQEAILSHAGDNNKIFFPDLIRELITLEVLARYYNHYFSDKYITNSLFELEKLNYLKEAERQATINAGLVHITTAIPDGIITQAYWQGIYGADARLAHRLLSRKIATSKVGQLVSKTKNKIIKPGSKPSQWLLKEFGIAEITAKGEIQEAENYTWKDFYKDQLEVAKGGFISNYLQDVAVGGGDTGYKGMMQLYVNSTLDSNNNAPAVNAFSLTLSAYYATLYAQGALDAADNYRSIIDGTLGAGGGFMVSPLMVAGAYGRAKAKVKAGEGSMTRNLFRETLRGTGFNLLMPNTNVKERNTLIQKNREVIQRFMSENGSDLFTSLALMHRYTQGLTVAANRGDVEGVDNAEKQIALETAYMLGIMKGTAFYDTVMKQLDTIIELGDYDSNKELIDNILSLIQGEDVQSDEVQDIIHQLDPDSKEILNYLKAMGYPSKITAELVSLKWNEALDNAIEMKQMIADTYNNRAKALVELPSEADLVLVHAYTSMLNYKDYLSRKLEKNKARSLELKEATLDAISDNTAKSNLDATNSTIYNIIYKTRAQLESLADKTKKEIEKALKKIDTLKQELLQTDSNTDPAEVARIRMQLGLETMNLLQHTAKEKLLEIASKKYKDRIATEEENEKPFISALDIINLDRNDLQFFLENLNSVTDELYREVLKILKGKSEVSDAELAMADTELGKPDFDVTNNYLNSILAVERTEKELMLVTSELNNKYYKSDTFLNAYGIAKNSIAESIFRAEYRNKVLQKLDDLNVEDTKDIDTKEWYRFYKDTMEEISDMKISDKVEDKDLALRKLELEQALRARALTSVMNRINNDAVTLFEINGKHLEQSLTSINLINKSILADNEKDIFIAALLYLEKNLEDPTITNLSNYISNATDLEKELLASYINDSVSLNYSAEDISKMLASYIDQYIQNEKDSKVISTEIKEDTEESDNPDDSIGDEEKLTPTEELELKKEEEIKRRNDQISAALHRVESINELFVKEVLATYGFHNVGDNLYLNAKLQLVLILQDALTLTDPYNYLTLLVNLAQEGSALKAFLNMCIEGLIKLGSINLNNKPKDKPQPPTTRVIENKNDVALIDLSELPEDSPLRDLYEEKEVFKFLSTHVFSNDAEIVFMNLNLSSDYVAALYLVPNTYTDYSYEIEGNKYQLLGFVPKNSNELFEGNTESGKLLHTTEGKKVRSYITNTPHVVLDDTGLPLAIADFVEGGRNSLASRFYYDKSTGLIKFKTQTSSTDTDTNTASWSTATQTPILETKLKDSGKTLLEVINTGTGNEIINFNSRTLNLAKSINYILKELLKDSPDLGTIKIILNSPTYGEGADTLSMKHALFPTALNGFTIVEENGEYSLCVNNNVVYNKALKKVAITGRIVGEVKLTENGEVRSVEDIIKDFISLTGEEEPLFKWQIETGKYTRTDKNQKYWDSNEAVILKDVDEGLLQIIPSRIDYVTTILNSINDGTTPKPIVSLEILDRAPSLSEKVLDQTELTNRWTNFVLAMNKFTRGSSATPIGQVKLSNIHSGRGSSNATTIDFETNNNNLVVSLVIGNTVDAIFRDIINTALGSSDYNKYSLVISKEDFDEIVRLAKTLKEELKSKYGAVQFFMGELNYINPKDGKYYGSPDIVFMDSKGNITIIDVKTTPKMLNLFSLALRGENLTDENSYIYNYNNLVTEYALKAEDLSSYFGTPIGVSKGLICTIHTNIDLNRFDVTHIKTEKDLGKTVSLSFLVSKKSSGKLQLYRTIPASTPLIYEINMNLWRATSRLNLADKGWIILGELYLLAQVEQADDITPDDISVDDINTEVESTPESSTIKEGEPVEGELKITPRKPTKMPRISSADINRALVEDGIDAWEQVLIDEYRECFGGKLPEN